MGVFVCPGDVPKIQFLKNLLDFVSINDADIRSLDSVSVKLTSVKWKNAHKNKHRHPVPEFDLNKNSNLPSEIPSTVIIFCASIFACCMRHPTYASSFKIHG